MSSVTVHINGDMDKRLYVPVEKEDTVEDVNKRAARMALEKFPDEFIEESVEEASKCYGLNVKNTFFDPQESAQNIVGYSYMSYSFKG